MSTDPIEQLEQLTAADKVQAMRRVRELAPKWDTHERRRYVDAFENLAHEFTKAARYLRSLEPPATPEFLREGTTAPLDSPATLRALLGD